MKLEDATSLQDLLTMYYDAIDTDEDGDKIIEAAYALGLKQGSPEVNAAKDGTWITFTASTGESATLLVEGLAELLVEGLAGKVNGPITQRALKNWCVDRQMDRVMRETNAKRL